MSLPRACPAGGGNRHGPERGGKRQRRGLCPRLPESTPGRSRRLRSLPAWRVAVKATNPHVAPKGVLVLPRKRPTCPLSRTRQINLHFWTLVWLLLLGIIILGFKHVEPYAVVHSFFFLNNKQIAKRLQLKSTFLGNIHTHIYILFWPFSSMGC